MLGVQEGGSGSLGQGSAGNDNIHLEDLTDVKNSDYGALVQEVKDSVMQASQSPCFSLAICQTSKCLFFFLCPTVFAPATFLSRRRPKISAEVPNMESHLTHRGRRNVF